MKTVLIVTTNTAKISDEILTGVWYDEFAIPYFEFVKQGYEITVASPQGAISPIDSKSVDKIDPSVLDVLNDTKKLFDIENMDFDAIFIPGGHGCMFDLAQNKILGKILEKMYCDNKIIAAICHGVCGLIPATIDNKPLVFGKKLTAFSNEEEALTNLGNYMPFLLESKLIELGAKYQAKKPWADFVVKDKNLITGQNQNCAKSLAKEVINTFKNLNDGKH